MFIDRAKIFVKAGGGGKGCVSFRRERFIPKGGPDGGDGGNGGSVFIIADDQLDTLLDFTARRHWNAQCGQAGMGKKKFGKSGQDLTIHVPTGTIIQDIDLDLTIKDLNQTDQTVCVARGGHGGRGNSQFATSTNQSPRFAEPGKPGQSRHLRLELKLIADIGLIGLPNAGKSTLISRISAARPKVADYPFTTTKPHLGIVELSDFRRFVVADIPGLIDGSHKGMGLGHDFLRHIERTRILAHLVDISGLDGSDPVQNYHLIRRELEQYSSLLAEKPEIIVATKTDLDSTHDKLKAFREAIDGEVIGISSVTGFQIEKLSEHLWRQAQQIKEQNV
ncbi:MAG: GTPase ObgE [Planctomycetes bacterium]|nr:GTPase ObgE [Planctomycetota bacterium]